MFVVKIGEEGKKLSESKNVTVFQKRFAFKESEFEVPEDSVKGRHVVIYHTFLPQRAQVSLINLGLLSCQLHEKGAKKVSLVAPYIPYSRQTPNKHKKNDFIVQMLECCRLESLLTFDFHNECLLDGLSCNVQNINSGHRFAKDISVRYGNEDCAILFCDKGAMEKYSKCFNKHKNTICVQKERTQNGVVSKIDEENSIKIKDKVCILVDDMIDSGGTAFSAAELVLKHKPQKIALHVSHILNQEKAAFLSNVIDEIHVTCTEVHQHQGPCDSKKFINKTPICEMSNFAIKNDSLVFLDSF